MFKTFKPTYRIPSGITAGINTSAVGTANRVAINALITELSDAGGGTVYLPAGTYFLEGTGTASKGVILMQNNTTLIGDGIGATILKVIDNHPADITGTVRTPSAEITTNVTIRDLTIDCNRSEQKTVSITALTQSGGTATATVGVAGDRPALNDEIYILGADQTEYNGYARVDAVPTSTTFEFTVDSGAVSPATGTITYGFSIDGFFCGVTPGSASEDNNITLKDVEFKNATRYGSDPHEQTRNLTHQNCIAHDNALDGFIGDFIEDGIWINCESYDNDRNGFTITTRSGQCCIINCDSYDNLGNGISVARGSDNVNASSKVSLTDNNVYSSTKENIIVRMARDVNIKGGSVELAGRHGLSIKGSMRVIVDGVNFVDNGQSSNNTYADILLIEEDNLSVTGITQTGGTATVTVADGDVPSIGTYITVSGANESGYNISGRVLTAPTSTTFTYAVDSGTASPATGTIIYARPAYKCNIGSNNTFDANQTNKVKYHIEETADSCDFNILRLGTAEGAVTQEVLASGINSIYKSANQTGQYITGHYFYPKITSGAISTKSMTANRKYYLGPFVAKETKTLTRLGISIDTGTGTGGDNAVLGVYTDKDGIPDQLVGTNNAEVAIDVAGQVEATVVIPVIRGKLYWQVINTEGTGLVLESFAFSDNVRDTGGEAYNNVSVLIRDDVTYAATLPAASGVVIGDYTSESAPLMWHREV